MKRLVLGSLTALVLAAMSPAQAADMAVKAMPVKAPIAPLWSWAGSYMGANLGYSWGRSRTDNTLSFAGAGGSDVSSASTNLNGVLGGLQVGHNWQQANFVYGVEADFQLTGQKGSTNFSCVTATCGFPPAITTGIDQKMPWFGTVRLRGGITVTPTTLAYLTGGLAYGQIKSNVTVTGTNVNGAATSVAYSTSSTNAGWVIGAGLETQLSGRWTGKVEYLYMDLGTVSGNSGLTTILGGVRTALTQSFSSRVTDNIVRVGVNYKF